MEIDGPAGPQAPFVLIARQPMFNAALEVVAYELFQGNDDENPPTVPDPIAAAAQVLANATLDIGFERLAGRLPAFIKFPASLLVSPIRLPLAAERIVIEVVGCVSPVGHLLDGLSRLRGEGYKIALDDFDIRRDNADLLDYADIVKVDVQQHTPEALAQSVRALRRVHLQLVAGNVETLEQLARCRSLGFDFFQGEFLQRPETFAERRASNSRMSVLDLILSLEEGRVSAEEVERCIARDIGLSYRLLRCINTTYYRTPREVASIRQAVLLIGYEELRRICAVMLLTSLSDRPSYVAIQALIRARMCEGLCARARRGECAGYFLAGLLSLVDVVLGAPMNECLEDLPLSASVREALLHQQGPVGSALRCVLSYERNDWEGVRFEELSAAEIASAYVEAVEWADRARPALACA